MSTHYSQLVARYRRRYICELLSLAPNYEANAAIVHGLLLEDKHHRASRDQVHTDIDWLEEQGCVVTEDSGVTALRVVRLTQRGVDVVSGNTTVSGIARPEPGA